MGFPAAICAPVPVFNCKSKLNSAGCQRPEANNYSRQRGNKREPEKNKQTKRDVNKGLDQNPSRETNGASAETITKEIDSPHKNQADPHAGHQNGKGSTGGDQQKESQYKKEHARESRHGRYFIFHSTTHRPKIKLLNTYYYNINLLIIYDETNFVINRFYYFFITRRTVPWE